MQSSPDWGRRFQSGRCKAIGVAWSDAELSALYVLKIPADYVRQGCLTLEQYKKLLKEVDSIEAKTGEKPLALLKKEVLVQKAAALGISFDESQVTRDTLISLIKQAEKSAQTNSGS